MKASQISLAFASLLIVPLVVVALAAAPSRADVSPVALVSADPSVACTKQGGALMCSPRDRGARYGGEVEDGTPVTGTLAGHVSAAAVPLLLPGHLGIGSWLVYLGHAATHRAVIPYGDFEAAFHDGYFDTYSKVADAKDPECCPSMVRHRRYAWDGTSFRKALAETIATPK